MYLVIALVVTVILMWVAARLPEDSASRWWVSLTAALAVAASLAAMAHMVAPL